MTNNADAQIAREWAETNINAFTPTPMTLDQRHAIAAHILATTAPPTMADVDWDDAVHAGLCAEHCDSDVVLMLGKEPGDDDLIYCRWFAYGEMIFGPLARLNLTPIPGTKIDLTPRREPEPESTPDHPEVPTLPTALVTEDDYRGAPYGTVVWGNGPSSNMSSSIEKYGNAWLEAGDDGTFTPRHMAAAGPHQVLRWGDVS